MESERLLEQVRNLSRVGAIRAVGELLQAHLPMAQSDDVRRIVLVMVAASRRFSDPPNALEPRGHAEVLAHRELLRAISYRRGPEWTLIQVAASLADELLGAVHERTAKPLMLAVNEAFEELAMPNRSTEYRDLRDSILESVLRAPEHRSD